MFSLLVVDDNIANLRVLGATFEDHGFRVYSATSVEEAQEALKANTNAIDLVLSDIQMPGLTGFDLVTWMKQDKGPIRAIPILLITSQLPESENRIKGLSLGAIDYLPRSLDPEELVLRAKHAIESFSNIRQLQSTLEKTECLVSTGRLFAASNHEIKNVAQIIQMGVGILEREFVSLNVSDTSRQAMKMLAQSSTLLSDVTKMIGALVSNTSATLGVVDIEAVLDHVVTMVRPLLKKDVSLIYEAGVSASVLGSQTYLKQILINLVLNARDAIEEAKSGVRGRIEIKVLGGEDAVEISVIDNGVGFPREETRSEFTPFASTKQMRGGTGLGLWLSSHLVQKMAGHLTLSSKGLGQGAEAKILLKRVNS